MICPWKCIFIACYLDLTSALYFRNVIRFHGSHKSRGKIFSFSSYEGLYMGRGVRVPLIIKFKKKLIKSNSTYTRWKWVANFRPTLPQLYPSNKSPVPISTKFGVCQRRCKRFGNYRKCFAPTGTRIPNRPVRTQDPTVTILRRTYVLKRKPIPAYIFAIITKAVQS